MPEGCLTDFVKQFGSLDEHLLRTYTRSIVEGIDYLHRRGIVHCDVKGKNVLVGNGSVKLTDFGSAKRVTTDGDLVSCAINGTPLWMAPEVVKQVEQGPASDIWSLGCTVVEMATGRAPWSKLAETNHMVALFHIGCADELPAVPTSLSPEAHDFLSHCLQRDPRQRWTSAQLLQHPFLTTRAPVTFKAPASPVSMMEFPSDSDGLSASFENSVPTLAAPSLFKRGLVSKAPKHVEDENWWSTPACPTSGPWIVVRSPKSPSSSSSAPPSSDWMTLTPVSDSPLEVPVAERENMPANCEASEIFLEPSALAPFLNIAAAPAAPAADDDCPRIQIATTFDFRHFAIPEMDSCLRHRNGIDPMENPHFITEKDEGRTPSRLNLGLAVMRSFVTEYSELVYQYSNPQILLYWWQSHRRRLQRRQRDSEKPWQCGYVDQCTIAFLNQYTLPLTTPSLAFVCLLLSLIREQRLSF